MYFLSERAFLNSITKISIILFVVIALFGQGFAVAAMSCEQHQDMTSQSHHNQMIMTQDMDTSQHHMSAEMTDDCCSVECQCPANGCSSISVLNNSLISSLIIIPEKIAKLGNLFASFESGNLYRPPILA